MAATAPCLHPASIAISRKAGAADMDAKHGYALKADTAAVEVVINQTADALSQGICGEVHDDADGAALSMIIGGAGYVICDTTGTRETMAKAATSGLTTTSTKGDYTPATFLDTGVDATRCLALIHPGAPRIGTYS